MHQILTELLAQPTNVPPDLRRRIDEVWNDAINNVAFMLSKQEYPGPDNDYRKLLTLYYILPNDGSFCITFFQFKICTLLAFLGCAVIDVSQGDERPLCQNLAVVAIQGHAKKGVSGIKQFYWIQSVCLPCIVAV